MSNANDLPPVRACLFDMDGLLIDSEDLYTICTNKILHEYGRPDLPWNIKAQLQGRPGPEASKIFHNWSQLPITVQEYQIKNLALQREHFPHTQTLPGVPALLTTLAHRTSPPIHLALATSSHRGNYLLKTAHLASTFAVFPEDSKVLGDDPRIPKGCGKPAPEIYLLALETINARIRAEGKEREVLPKECLVFEDSVPGVEAGRRAGMRVLWCPHPGLRGEYAGREGEVLAGVLGEGGREARTVDGEGRERGVGELPGRVGDGWGRLVETLEGFPYAEMGVQVKSE